MMKRKLATLMIFLIGMAFSVNVGAIEQNQTGKVEVHGFVTQGYFVTDENNFMADTEGNGTFQFNEVGINFASDVSERLRLGVQFLARDLGKMGNKEVTIDWAVADYSVSDWLNIKAGRNKVAHGLYNFERDVDMLRTFIFLPQSVYTEGWRDSVNATNGLGAYGYIPLGLAGNISYYASIGNASIQLDGGEVRQLEDQVPKDLELKVTDVDTGTTGGGQIALDTVLGIEGLRLAATGFHFEMDATCELNNGKFAPAFVLDEDGVPMLDPNEDVIKMKENRIFNLKLLSTTGSLEFARGNLVFAAEYMNNSYNLKLPVNPLLHMLSPDSVPENGIIERDFDAVGYYASLTYRFTDWLELGTYYSEYYRDKDDKDGDKAFAAGLVDQKYAMWLKDLCLTARFDITPNWILKLESHMMDGAALLYSSDDNTVVNPNTGKIETDYEQDWYMFAGKLSYSF